LTPDIYAQWLQGQGHHIIRTESSYWHSQGPRVYQAFPYHWVIQPSEDELLQLLHRNQIIGLRYSTTVETPLGCIGYHAIYEKPSYTLDNLSKWARKNVRRGLKNCRVESISFERLTREGWVLQKDTLDRQGRHGAVTEEKWQQICLGAGALPGFEAWGALVEGHLAASVVTLPVDDCCYMLYQQSHRDYLQQHVNNALSFIVTQTMINRPAIRSVFYALHSLDAPPNVDQFKFRMGYRAKPVRQRVLFHPWLSPMFNPASHAVVRQLRRWRPNNPTLAKTEGMLRFYLEGKRPLDEQHWPECLTEIKLRDKG